jgi:hypothetical protein
MPSDSWLLLVHQLPPKPPYLRVKVWRRLQALGAVPLKNSVYLLPNTEEAREDFEWILREIHKEHGEASLCEARLVDGLTDEEVRGLFHRAREEDFRALASDVRKFASEALSSRSRSVSDEVRAAAGTAIARFRKRLSEIEHIDFFGAPGREAAEGLIADLERRITPQSPSNAAAVASPALELAQFQKRTWVTRKGIHIDRMACAWLIRRFIDKEAAFKFVPARGYEPEPGELRFDMFDADFTHEGDLCSFEVMVQRFRIADPALAALGEVVHDIDLKDSKFNRDETPGIDHLIAGIAWLHGEDEARLEHGTAVFDALHSFLLRRKSVGRTT